MNRDIEDGKILNWQLFKKLKQHKAKSENFNSLDMENFENFFSSLYADEHASVNDQSKDSFLRDADCLDNTGIKEEVDAILNSPISYK